MTIRIKVTIALLSLLTLSGCISTPTDPAEAILGSWESSVGGFSVITTFSDDSVTIDGYEPRAYKLEGNRLVVDGDDLTARIVSFPASGEMVQLDELTDTQQSFRRIET